MEVRDMLGSHINPSSREVRSGSEAVRFGPSKCFRFVP